MAFGIVESMNLIFMGKIGDAALISGVGVGNVYINVFGVVMMGGLNSILSTLVSQSYGQKNLKLCGVYLNRGRLVLILAYVPIFIILMNA